MKKVCVQGLGFVGAAMAIAVANARDLNNKAIYYVTGVDQETEIGKARINSINQGIFPFTTSDQKLISALGEAKKLGNLVATTDESVYEDAEIVVVDVGLEIPYLDKEPQLQMGEFQNAVRSVCQRIQKGALLVIETTVPPGTCDKLVSPLLEKELQKRGLEESSIHLAHSFERVMPGSNYLDSIVNFWRVYAGQTEAAADACEEFLTSIIDTDRFPLTRVSTTRGSELAKVMENTYRAVTIAFVDEWTKYAELIGIDLFEVIDAIRVRPTHSNIRSPGLGVGGYCLTKDPALAPAAARQLFELNDLKFPFSELAIQVNEQMPLHTVNRLKQLIGKEDLCDTSILVLGLAYRQDIGDTRYSPAGQLIDALIDLGASVEGYDPLLTYWPERDWNLPEALPAPDKFDAVILTIQHREFFDLDLLKWLGAARPIVLDAANIFSRDERNICRKAELVIESIGRGDGL